MTVERRMQGRPTRGPNEVGRHKIVENLRAMMRNGDVEDFSRKSLAEYAGVTPALITYYFPTRTSLIKEATKPVIERYAEELRTLLHSDENPTERLLKVVRLLIRCFSCDGRLLNAYEELLRTEHDQSSPNYLEAMSKELAAFFDTLIGASASTPLDCDVLQRAVWGMCEVVARRGLNTPSASYQGKDVTSEADISVSLFDFITHGLSHWVAMDETRTEAMARKDTP